MGKSLGTLGTLKRKGKCMDEKTLELLERIAVALEGINLKMQNLDCINNRMMDISESLECLEVLAECCYPTCGGKGFSVMGTIETT